MYVTDDVSLFSLDRTPWINWNLKYKSHPSTSPVSHSHQHLSWCSFSLHCSSDGWTHFCSQPFEWTDDGQMDDWRKGLMVWKNRLTANHNFRPQEGQINH